MNITKDFQEQYRHIMTAKIERVHMQYQLTDQVSELKLHCVNLEEWLAQNLKHPEWMDIARHRTTVLGVIDTKQDILYNIRTNKASHGVADNFSDHGKRNGYYINNGSSISSI